MSGRERYTFAGFFYMQFEEEAPVVNTVPEPSTFMLLGSGLDGFALIRRFRRK